MAVNEEDERNLLAKVNLNGTELVIADMDARNAANTAITSANTNASNVSAITTRVTNLEIKSNSLTTATYDAQSSTLSLTSNNKS